MMPTLLPGHSPILKLLQSYTAAMYEVSIDIIWRILATYGMQKI